MTVDATMAGKTCLITGGTSGIGEVTARELARKGATVVVVGRDPKRCEATIGRIREQVADASVSHLVADLSSQKEVRKLADEFRSRHDRLDVLLNNAGAMFAQRQVTVDGIERTWALNHLAYFLLTNLLLDTLKASAPSRVVSVASDAHRVVSGIRFDDPEFKDRYRPFLAYGQSKLANILFSNELARRLEGTGVTSNSLHPGFVATNFTAGNGFLGWAFRVGARIVAITPEKGAETSTYLASSPEVEGVTGKFFAKCRPIEPKPAGKDPAAAARLWHLSEEMTGVPVTS